MPLFAESSVPGSGVKPAEPGVHCITTPVMRCAKASSKDLSGVINTVATIVPSLNAATLLKDILPGASTQPVQAAVGAAPLASSSNTSTDSRPP